MNTPDSPADSSPASDGVAPDAIAPLVRRSFARSVGEKVLFALAWLVLALSAIGIVLPILPTTPLVLLASILFAKSSPRFDAWLRRTRLYRSYVVPFRESGGMTVRKKVAMFAVTAATCAISFALVDILPVRIILATMVLAMGFALTRIIKTISPEEDARLRAQWAIEAEAE